MGKSFEKIRRILSKNQTWFNRIAIVLPFFIFISILFARGWNPKKPFERNAPEVDEAIFNIQKGQFESAQQALTSYLETGPCSKTGIGVPERVRLKSDGAFDLGLTLFYIAEKYGKPFGEEESQGESTQPDNPLRTQSIDCALLIVNAIASDMRVPIELRARARYLAGNLEFLRKNYQQAVQYYDQALKLIPGNTADASIDNIGQDAAWNRAIALLRIQNNPDAGSDAGQPPPDASNQEPDASKTPDSGNNSSDGGDEPDAGNQNDDGDSGTHDAGAPQPQPSPSFNANEAPQDDRVLDQFEQAPTYQEQEAKLRAAQRRSKTMEDK